MQFRKPHCTFSIFSISTLPRLTARGLPGLLDFLGSNPALDVLMLTWELQSSSELEDSSKKGPRLIWVAFWKTSLQNQNERKGRHSSSSIHYEADEPAERDLFHLLTLPQYQNKKAYSCSSHYPGLPRNDPCTTANCGTIYYDTTLTWPASTNSPVPIPYDSYAPQLNYYNTGTHSRCGLWQKPGWLYNAKVYSFHAWKAIASKLSMPKYIVASHLSSMHWEVANIYCIQMHSDEEHLADLASQYMPY